MFKIKYLKNENLPHRILRIYIDRRVKKQELNIIDMNSNEKTKQ